MWYNGSLLVHNLLHNLIKAPVGRPAATDSVTQPGLQKKISCSAAAPAAAAAAAAAAARVSFRPYSTFFLKEQPSVSLHFPPVGWHSMTLQLQANKAEKKTKAFT